MKFNLNLSTADKIGTVIGGVVIWTIGIVPTVLIGGTGWFYKKEIRNFLIKRKAKEKVRNVFNYINNLRK